MNPYIEQWSATLSYNTKGHIVSPSTSEFLLQKAVLTGHVGEAVEGVAGTRAGVKFRRPAHRIRNHFPGELWVDMLSVGRAPLNVRKDISKVVFGYIDELGVVLLRNHLEITS